MLNCACRLCRPGRAWIGRSVAPVCLSVCLSVRALKQAAQHARSVEILSTTAKLYENIPLRIAVGK